MCKGYLRAEVAAREDEGSDVRDKFDEMVEALDAKIDQGCYQTPDGRELADAMHDANVASVEGTFLGKIPLPRYSAAHAPGGDLETRDIAEAEHYHQALRELLAGRDTIADQYEANHGPGFAFNHAKTKKDKKENILIAGAERMRAEEEPTDGGPEKFLFYKAATIRAWLKEMDQGTAPTGRRSNGSSNVVYRTGAKLFERRDDIYSIYPEFQHALEVEFADAVRNEYLKDGYRNHLHVDTVVIDQNDSNEVKEIKATIKRDVETHLSRVVSAVTAHMSTFAADAVERYKASRDGAEPPSQDDLLAVAKSALPTTFTSIIGTDTTHNKVLVQCAKEWGKEGSHSANDNTASCNRFRRYVTLPVASAEEIARFAVVQPPASDELRAASSAAGPSGHRPPEEAVVVDDDDDEPALKRPRAMPSQDEILYG
jgi:hypothetical protein